MGLQFKELVVKKEISISELKGKVVAVDAMNMLYQFLTTIRGPDGSPLRGLYPSPPDESEWPGID